MRATRTSIAWYISISLRKASSSPARSAATSCASLCIVSTASRDHGARVALIERHRWGGSCPNVACRPTKAYLVAAELAYTVNELSDWMGVDCGPARVDLARVRAWKD